MDIVFFNDIFGLLTSIRRAKMKSQFCDVAKIGDFCNFLAFPQIKDWFLHWIFKIKIVFSLKHDPFNFQQGQHNPKICLYLVQNK